MFASHEAMNVRSKSNIQMKAWQKIYFPISTLHLLLYLYICIVPAVVVVVVLRHMKNAVSKKLEVSATDVVMATSYARF